MSNFISGMTYLVAGLTFMVAAFIGVYGGEWLFAIGANLAAFYCAFRMNRAFDKGE